MKFDMDTAIKSLALGAGAVVLPVFAGKFVANFAWLSTSLGNAAITVGGVLLAAVGVYLVDQMFFSK